MSSFSILVVDDDQDMADSLVDIFDEFEYQASAVYNGADAVAAYKRSPADIVFLDVKMQGMDGVACLSQIRAFDPNAKIIMITGYGLEEVMAQAVEGGAVSVMRKPVDIERMLKEVEQVLPNGIVLVADDDPDFVESMRALLTDNDYAVHLASTGEDALHQVLSGSVDILMLDLKLPVMSGLEVYLEIKNRQPPPPTIIVTGYADELKSDVDLLRSLDVAGILSKPFDPDVLIDITRRLTA